jgi:HTH-type transcriptional regulator, transcriptional repressor of NAD biosynthesis genes
MTKVYRLGLVVGKFAPLHLGHVFVVEKATQQCERVAILSYTNPELPGYGPDLREAWLLQCFPDATVIVATPAKLADWFRGADVPQMPPNDASDLEQRHFVAILCARVLGAAVDVVFTSEDYGEGFAAHLTAEFKSLFPRSPAVQHVMVDRQRQTIPISATRLRADLWSRWHYLPAPVARGLVRRVAILGGESSGKTMLAQRLAQEFETEWVPEYGRELWEAKRGQLTYDDLADIGREQIRREDAAVTKARAYVFCDTSPLTTLFYSLEMFGRADPDLREAAQRPYSAVALCAPDFPFVQDGTRRDESFRAQQHAWYQAELGKRGVPYTVAYGSIEDRVATVRNLVAP